MTLTLFPAKSFSRGYLRASRLSNSVVYIERENRKEKNGESLKKCLISYIVDWLNIRWYCLSQWCMDSGSVIVKEKHWGFHGNWWKSWYSENETCYCKLCVSLFVPNCSLKTCNLNLNVFGSWLCKWAKFETKNDRKKLHLWHFLIVTHSSCNNHCFSFSSHAAWALVCRNHSNELS